MAEKSLVFFLYYCTMSPHEKNILTNVRLKKIAVVGPESTGKSVMAQALARHFTTIYVPEYAREYCRFLKRAYTMEDEMNMFYGQLALERSMIPLAKNNFLFADTMVLTIKIWCDHLFGFTPPEVLKEIQEADYDLYLLMDIDLPWEDDPLRDFPDQRDHFMKVWVKELENIGANYHVISGIGESRFQKALNMVNSL